MPIYYDKQFAEKVIGHRQVRSLKRPVDLQTHTSKHQDQDLNEDAKKILEYYRCRHYCDESVYYQMNKAINGNFLPIINTMFQTALQESRHKYVEQTRAIDSFRSALFNCDAVKHSARLTKLIRDNQAFIAGTFANVKEASEEALSIDQGKERLMDTFHRLLIGHDNRYASVQAHLVFNLADKREELVKDVEKKFTNSPSPQVVPEIECELKAIKQIEDSTKQQNQYSLKLENLSKQFSEWTGRNIISYEVANNVSSFFNGSDEPSPQEALSLFNQEILQPAINRLGTSNHKGYELNRFKTEELPYLNPFKLFERQYEKQKVDWRLPELNDTQKIEEFWVSFKCLGRGVSKPYQGFCRGC